MSRDAELLKAKLFMAEAFADDLPEADPDAFLETISIAAEGLLAARDSVAFHRILENNELTIEE